MEKQALDLDDINKIATRGNFLPTKRRTELSLNQKYLVTDLKVISTKFGPKVVVALNDECIVYLPPRLSNAFQQDPTKLEKYREAAAAERLEITFLDGEFNPCLFSNADQQ
uniref:64 protein n=1 Tax=Fopius arisanus TaxID=64838 RepID=A0A0C9RLJ3_9HYME